MIQLLLRVKARMRPKKKRMATRRRFIPANSYAEKPESEILAKFFADMGENCGEKMAKLFADFRPSISRKSGRKKFHEKLGTNSAGH